jgi:hypothetical protein
MREALARQLLNGNIYQEKFVCAAGVSVVTLFFCKNKI